jgi:hypothetical protein
MDDDEKKELERIGQEAGEAARSKTLKALKRRKATPGLVALQLKQLMDWWKTKEKAGSGKR